MLHMIPFPPSFDTDEITVCAPASTDPNDQDSEGAYDPTPGPTGPPLACNIQDTTTQGQGTSYQPGPAPFGLARQRIRCRYDPGVTAAGQQINWTKHWGVARSPVVILVAVGSAKLVGVEYVFDADIRD